MAELRKANGTVRKEKRQRKVTGLDGKYLSTAIKSLEESLPKGQSFLGVLARSARELAQDVDDLSVMTKKHAALKADVQGELNRIDRQITEFENKTQQSHEFLSMYEDLENALADYCAEAIEPEEDQNSRTSEADKSPNDFNEMLKDLNRAKKNEVALPPEATFDPQQAQPDLAAEFERKKREFLARGPRNRPIVTSPQAIPKQHSSSSTLVGDILGGFAQGVLIGAQIMSAVPQRGRTPVPTYTSPVIIPPSSNQRPLIPCKEWYQNTLAKGKNPPSLASVCPGQ